MTRLAIHLLALGLVLLVLPLLFKHAPLHIFKIHRMIR